MKLVLKFVTCLENLMFIWLEYPIEQKRLLFDTLIVKY